MKRMRFLLVVGIVFVFTTIGFAQPMTVDKTPCTWLNAISHGLASVNPAVWVAEGYASAYLSLVPSDRAITVGEFETRLRTRCSITPYRTVLDVAHDIVPETVDATKL